MAHATGSLRDLIYAQEWEFGVSRWSPAVTDIAKRIRNTGDTINLTKNTTQSAELTGDRAIRYLRHGNEAVGGDISFEFAPGAFDDFLAAAIGGTWGLLSAVGTLTLATQPEVGDTITIGSATFTFAASKSDKYSVVLGDTVLDTQANLSLAVSKYCSVATLGTWAANAATLTARYAGTWANAVPTTSNLTAVGDGFAATILGGGTDGNVVKQGTAIFSYSIEKGFTDIAQYGLYRGCVVNGMSLDISTDATVTGSFTFVGAGSGAFYAASAETGSIADPMMSEPFSAHESEVLIDGIDDCIVTALNITVDNGMTANYSICGPEAVSVAADRVNVTGTITALFEDAIQLNKFIQEESSTLALTLTDSAGNEYEFYFPKIKYTGGDLPVSGGGVISVSLPFQALYDNTPGTETALRITRTLVV